MLKSAPRKRFLVLPLLTAVVDFFVILPGTTAAQMDQSTSLQDTTPAAVQSLIFDFDHFPTGPVNEGFVSPLRGDPQSVQWQIRTEPSARSGQKVLAQTTLESNLAQTNSDEAALRSPSLLYRNVTVKNVEVGVSFKPISGKIDQAAGLIVRYQDQDHFYVVQANTRKEDVQLYKVVDGVRSSLAGANAPMTMEEWHWMKLVVKDTHFQLFFKDTLLLEADDSTYLHEGQVGLSTQSEGVILFDDFYITPLDQRP